MNKDYSEFKDNDLLIQWQDGLPLDEVEVVENVVKRINNGLMSHLRAIMDIDEVSKEDAQDELDQIGSEKQSNADIESSKFTIKV